MVAPQHRLPPGSQANPARARSIPHETIADVLDACSRKGVNLRTQLERIIAKAGHQVWPRLFQNLRASCATDWVERYPSHVVAKWLGHSPKVAAQRYLMSRDHHFEDAVVGGRAAGVPTAGDTRAGPTCDAICDSARVRTGQHGAARNDRTRCHHSGYSGFFGSCAVYQNGRAVHDAAQKQPAGAMDGPAGVKWRGRDSNL